MAGRKHFGDTIIEEVLLMKKNGKTNTEISEYFGFKNQKVINNLINRYHRKQRQLEAGVLTRKKGRPRKTEAITETSKDQLIRQLQMENELLRSFLYEVGRR